MRLNQFIFFIASTVVLGAVAGVVTTVTGLWLHVQWFTGLISGAFFSTTSLMGFWAYLTLNFVARITLPRRVWRWAQGLALLVCLYDMLYWRYHLNVTLHPASHDAYMPYFLQGFLPLVAGIIGAVLKARQSGRASFLPALFFLYLFTVIDALPFIWLEHGWSESQPLVNQTLIIMMICNLYLTLIYAKLLNPVTPPLPEPLPRRRKSEAGTVSKKQKRAEKASAKKAKRDERKSS